jgi:hypothetical protein
MTSIIKTIYALNNTAQVAVKNNDVNEIEWLNDTAPIDKADILAKQIELTEAEDAAVAQLATDKASAKAKLIAGEALTEAEADTIVL